MARSRSPWRSLRPVLLAGAATLTWLTFSSTAASADTLSDTASLLGGVTSSISSADKGLSPDPLVPAPAQSPDLLQPVVSPVSNLADDVIASVPVINRMVPVRPVSTITVPIAQLADGTTSAVIETVVPPVTEAVPVLEPVLNPVADLATGKTPIPVPALPGQIGDDGGLPLGPGSAPAESKATDTGSTAKTADTAQGTGPASVSAAEVSSLDALAAGASLQFSGTLPGGSGPTAGHAFSGSVALSMAGESPGAVDPAPSPGPVPAAPGVSGTGSGASSAAVGSGSAAWLNSFDLHLPLAGSSRAGELLEHAPAPVSFDPGSSPD